MPDAFIMNVHVACHKINELHSLCSVLHSNSSVNHKSANHIVSLTTKVYMIDFLLTALLQYCIYFTRVFQHFLNFSSSL